MTAPGPRWSGAGDPAPWVVIGCFAAALTGFALAWLGGSLGAAIAGAGWHPPPFTANTAAALVREGPRVLWPQVDPTWPITGMLTVTGVVAALIVPAGIWIGHRVGSGGGLARLGQLRTLRATGAATRARRLRPSLATARHVGADDAGVLLGDLSPGRVPLYASWEDTLLAVMGPRAGKSAALAAQAGLRAPGPVVLTSNRADVYTVTQASRARTGQVWVLDPQHIAHLPRGLWWDMLAEAATLEGARRLAGHFVTSSIPGAAARRDFWISAASNVLTAMFHAAARRGGRVADVLGWLANPTDRAPAEALREAGLAVLGGQMHATIRGAAETREGIYETARQCAACLLDPDILAWVTPDPARPPFDPAAFVASTDTLYLLSKHGDGLAANALVAALVDAVLRAGVGAAERAGGRLDPPLLAVLDEAANICRIADLPDLYSHLGSRGIVPLTVLQSYRQGVGVWGQVGMDSLWSASTIKVLGAGLDDADFAERISRLLGEHRLPEFSVSAGRHGRSVSRTWRPQRVMTAGQIRAIPRGQALLLATGLPPAVLRLRHWHTDRDAARLHADTAAEQAAITARAQHRPGGHWR